MVGGEQPVRCARSLMAVVIMSVAACAPSDSLAASAPVVPFLNRLPLLSDLPDMAGLTYRVPAERGFFKDDDQWSDCGHYPEVGDLSAVGVQGEYEAPVPGHADWPTFVVRLRPALGDENVAAEFSDWTQRCVGGELETLNPRIPFGAVLLTLSGPGVRRKVPPAVKILAASSGGVTFEAWTRTGRDDERRIETQLGLLARSFLGKETPAVGKLVVDWTPAELSRLFVFPGRAWGKVEIAYDSKPGESRIISPLDKVCQEDPLRASGYAGVSNSDQPDDVDPLVEFSGKYPDEVSGAPLTVVYRERAGVDSLARMRDWVSQCQSRPSSVPQICAAGGAKPLFVAVATTIEGEQVLGYRRLDPVEYSGGHSGHTSCGAKAQVARTVRVAGLLVHTELVVDTSDGPPDWASAAAALEEQVGQVVKALRHAR